MFLSDKPTTGEENGAISLQMLSTQIVDNLVNRADFDRLKAPFHKGCAQIGHFLHT
jgi:hypothetical protein